ncbi:uncharacterized protein CG7065-like isoform X1 [Cydia splendana]|uniref:uncharacterized protein CG7065-like isoform X1 n=2 Tax=Cydia splendana TaxID=1100963 RepID=UPI00300D5D43
MDLPDCPPGAEGYQDSVTEIPKKPELEDSSCTKAEQEFQEHLNSLRISCEDGSQRCMVERRGRDVSGKWIYLCYPCAAVCSGETILQTHISGKKHKIKIAMRNVWPLSLFDEHPFIQTERGTKTEATEKVLQKMAQEVDMHNKNASEFDKKYGKYRDVTCHIQSIVDNVKAPLLGLEYLVEHPPEQAHYEPSYTCTLCSKQGHPRTIINHMTCFWHRYNYLVRHFAKACSLMTPYRAQPKYREGVAVIMNRLAQRIEDKHGRQRPVHIDKEEYENDKESIHQWIFKGFHYSETNGPTFEEVVDIDLINTLLKSDNDSKLAVRSRDRDPSPPHVAAPSKPHFNPFSRSGRRQERRGGSLESLSDISDEQEPRRRPEHSRGRPEPPHDRDRDPPRGKYEHPRARYEPYPDKRRTSPYRSRFAIRNPPAEKPRPSDKQRAPNYAYKLKLAEDKRMIAEESAQKTLAYHEKNPEKHPLYPEEWKKFWNRRYKEIQAEGKDPSKHDFKPEWIVFWTARMKELHDAELKVVVNEIYRKLCISPPDMRPRSPELKAKSMERRRSPEARRRSPPKRRSPDPRDRARSPDSRRREPHFEPRRKSPARRVSPDPRLHRRARSPVRTNFTLESVRRSRSPLSRREAELRNRSPAPPPHHAAPSMQTVTISDDELKIDENISPWNSDDMDSIGSVPEARSPGTHSARAGSVASRGSRSRREYRGPLAPAAAPQDLGPPENVVVTLRLLVALEDYLGSLGPKIVDMLTEALRMEKEKANSSEELLERESAVVLIETAKEKLKGAVQAGLVATAAVGAVRAAIVRAAATLHVADTRALTLNKGLKSGSSAGQAGNATAGAGGAGVSVAGVGSVDRAQIAQQMAAALVAQGKTDVSSEELAQLVDAVVGIAEEKKRQEQSKKRMENKVIVPPTAKTVSGTASALQMLQSAYDENDKKAEKTDAPDAMDGLSDSDLETLLKNFNELSAEEQHSLIAYLKKLEAREPQRVERLRQYVSAAASAGAPAAAAAAAAPSDEPPARTETPRPAPAPEPAPAPAPGVALKPIAIDSDDDDYTVEEVFKSVTEKVKEDQIRQEMEIVKKSLEETKVETVAGEVVRAAPPDVSKNMSSAANLLALVQASIQSSAAATSTLAPPSDVVASTLQPRSFGDMPIPPVHAEPSKPQMRTVPITTLTTQPGHQLDGFNNQQHHHTPFTNLQTSLAGPIHDRPNFGGNNNSHVNVWDQRPMHNMPEVRGSMLRAPGYSNYGQNTPYNQQVPRGNFMNGRMQDSYDTRQDEMSQQFERPQYDQNNYGRRGGGGGRGHFGGPGGAKRGRGRGYY